MPNKFTQKLDSIVPLPYSGGILWRDVNTICPEFMELTCSFVRYPGMTSSIADWDTRVIFFCFLAEFSDQDLEEMFPEIFAAKPLP